VDHKLTGRVTLFARYNHAPSYQASRLFQLVNLDQADTDTMTAGATAVPGPTKVNDFRANWSRSTAANLHTLTSFNGGMAPPTSVPFPPSSPYRPDKGRVNISLGVMGIISAGPLYSNLQEQLNFLDTFSWAVGAHQLKFGLDYRQLNPLLEEIQDITCSLLMSSWWQGPWTLVSSLLAIVFR
jgi:hypothetical protein